MLELPPSLESPTVIRDNQRFVTYRAMYNNQPVFVKRVKHPQLAGRIWQEAWGIETFAELRAAAGLPFELPEVVGLGEDYIVTTWVAGSSMDFTPVQPGYEESIDFFARSLVTIDQLSRFANRLAPQFDTTAVGGRSDIERLHNRLTNVDYLHFFDQAFIDRCFEYLVINVPKLEARFTHPDFTPNNVLVNGDVRTLIDFESVGLRWPRFYDLVNLTYNRMIMEPELTAGCVQVARLYFEQNNDALIEECTTQLNAIAMVRSLSMIAELMSKPDAYHNTQQIMTPETADRLRTYASAIMNGTVYFEAVPA